MTHCDPRFDVPGAKCSVSALLLLPADRRVVYVLGHGAGAGMHHSFLETIVVMLAELDVGAFRYQFPYFDISSPIWNWVRNAPLSPSAAWNGARGAPAHWSCIDEFEGHDRSARRGRDAGASEAGGPGDLLRQSVLTSTGAYRGAGSP